MVRIDREVQDPIIAEVVNHVIDRSEIGIIKYGVTLERGDLNTVEWIQHFQEELLDAANYAQVLKHKIQIAQSIINASMSNFEKVVAWNEKFEAGREPSLWMALIVEEFKETLEAFGLRNVQVSYDGAAQEMDKVGVLDGICDLLWVTYGLGWSMHFEVNEAFEEVNRSNNSKLWADGKVHKNESGKIIKDPSTYSPPKLKKFIDAADKDRFGDIIGFSKNA